MVSATLDNNKREDHRGSSSIVKKTSKGFVICLRGFPKGTTGKSENSKDRRIIRIRLPKKDEVLVKESISLHPAPIQDDHKDNDLKSSYDEYPRSSLHPEDDHIDPYEYHPSWYREYVRLS